MKKHKSCNCKCPKGSRKYTESDEKKRQQREEDMRRQLMQDLGLASSDRSSRINKEDIKQKVENIKSEKIKECCENCAKVITRKLQDEYDRFLLQHS